jgi:hypothetical protein
MFRVTATVTLAWLLAAFGSAPVDEAQVPVTPPAPQNCTAPEHRQFDFWIGEWEVTAGDQPAGTNRIAEDLKGCVLVEQWTAKGGGRGSSLNFYDRRTRAWHQTWIDEQGGALRLEGGLRDGAMVLQSEPQPDAKGVPTIQRITWSPGTEGSVRQHWESSRDGGATWTTVFDGRYVKSR